ncbi:MAG: glutamate--tRNA ligase [Victivallales bacterium]|nr:glutamate--tRNA ligase [Victivallales bacterium]MCF7888672.1 glutamate--tRNA ligase [Victivallales bacterium]
MTVKVRFAPSPTGKIHIGNIRTAIFNWLFARHTGGKFLLRVEDTDKERSTQEAIDRLFECMKWLGLDYDGEVYYQSRHEKEHQRTIEKLITEEKAYVRTEGNETSGPVLFRIPFNLNNCEYVQLRGTVEQKIHPEIPLEMDYTGIKFAQISRKGKPIEFSGCIAGFKDLEVYDSAGQKVYALTDSDVSCIFNRAKTVRLEKCSKIVYTRREIIYKDLIKGKLSKPLDSIKDLVIARSDGSPVFHIANVCDDIEQGVTHIIRGDDHVENTYRHLMLFYAMDYNSPYYGHMPMIVNKQGKPYSKRDGDAFVGDFRIRGIMPEAMFNYLSLLGWAPGDDKEKMDKNEIVSKFTLDRVKSSSAQFDINKLLNMNALYMSDLDKETFLKLALEKAVSQGWFDEALKDKFRKAAELMQGRTKQISMVSDWKYFFFNDSPLFHDNQGDEAAVEDKLYTYDPKAVKKILKKTFNISGIKCVADKFRKTDVFTAENIERCIREAESELDIPEGKLNQPVRVSVTGKSGGADLIETLIIIGKENTVFRMEKIVKLFKD